MNLKKEALDYHEHPKPGKIALETPKPCATAHDLALAYSPGVAYPCLEIQKKESDAYRYTAKSNLVGVISNGTAVLGLGDIGAQASKPVMEGKAVLFKRFAGIDVFDIEVNEKDPQKFIETVQRLEPTFGGINLEDIKAPECFIIESTLKRTMNIPVFHDDQHGTAVIVLAALKNAAKLTNRTLNTMQIVINGAGAAALSIAELLIEAGAQKKHLFMFDSKGLITVARKNLNEYKKQFAQSGKAQSLAESLEGADVFIGVSKGNLLTAKMVAQMNRKPIIFALANPNPEILPEEAKKGAPDAIMATGRTDYPNQVNNVLGFPYLFRAALDVRATEINNAMKVAAADALAALTHEPVPEAIKIAYKQNFSFGPDYIIPKPLDPRLLWYVTPKIAQAAVDSGVARKTVTHYEKQLKELATELQK